MAPRRGRFVSHRYIQPDRVRVGARRDHKIVLQLSALIAVVDKIDARVDVIELYPAKRGYVRPPLARVVADEIIALAWQRIEASRGRARIRAGEFHRENGVVACSFVLTFDSRRDSRRSIAFPQREHGLIVRQKQAVTLAAREEADPWIGLSFIGLEAERQVAEAASTGLVRRPD